jgi:hypothetical protein
MQPKIVGRTTAIERVRWPFRSAFRVVRQASPSRSRLRKQRIPVRRDLRCSLMSCPGTAVISPQAPSAVSNVGAARAVTLRWINLARYRCVVKCERPESAQAPREPHRSRRPVIHPTSSFVRVITGVGLGGKGSHLIAGRRYDETDLRRLYAVNPIELNRSRGREK